MSKHKYIDYELLNNQELYFYYWLEELYNHGYIDYIHNKQITYPLNNPLTITWNKQLKTKVKPVDVKLIKERSYTPDFIFRFSKKSKGIFYYEDSESNNIRPFFPNLNSDNLIHVDTKGEYTRVYTSSITFGDRQAIMWDKHSIFVQVVKPYIRLGKKCLFETTFTPAKVITKEVFLRDDKKRKIKKGDSKIKYKTKTLKQFINELQNKTT